MIFKLNIKLTIFLILAFNSFVFSQIDFEDYQKSLRLYDEGSAAIESNNFDLAIEKLIEAISIDSLNRGSYINLYHACYKIKKYELILPYIETAKQIFLEDDEILYYSGNIYQKLEFLDQAIMNYDSAIVYSKINGEDYPIVYAYYLNRGICHIKQENYNLAKNDFNYALQLNEKEGIIFINRGIANYKLKKLENACADWESAYNLGLKSAHDYINKYCL